MMQRTLKALVAVGIFVIAVVILSPMTAAQDQTINLGEIRIINGLVGLGNVDVYLDGRAVAFALQPTTATTYLAVPVGQHSIAVRIAGGDELAAPVADILFDLVPNQSRTAIVYQKQFAEAEQGGYIPPLEQSGAIMLLDDNRSPIELGRARLTVAHLAPGSPNRLSITYPDRASLLHEVTLEQPYGTIDVDSTVYPLAIVDATSSSLTRLELVGEISFYANTLYTLVIVPDISPNPNARTLLPGVLSASMRLFFVSAPIDPPLDGIRMRVIHAAHDTAVVDLYIDERLATPRLTYSHYTEYMGLAGYTHTIALRNRDAAPDSEPLAVARFAITPENQNQKNWTILMLNATDQNVSALSLIDTARQTSEAEVQPQIINTPGGTMVMALVPDNIAQTEKGTSRVRLIHAVDGALDLSLFTDALPLEEDFVPPTPRPGPTPTPSPPIQLIEPVVFGAEANESEVPAGLYENLEFRASRSSVVRSLENAHLVSGVVYTYVVIGQPGGEPPVEVLQLEEYGRGVPQERQYIGTIISNQAVNVRERANAASIALTQIANGTEVEVMGRNFDGTWVIIRFVDPTTRSRREGWVSSSLIRVTRLGEPINVLSLPQVTR
ncbi:MAG: DUF4397 domain-containing protein [Candidatus Methanoperedens sp.]|nr:DUF4397 domain-containing protein [Candidatus Methanoperedens sp.]